MFTNNMFCAKSDNGADTCQGDSGGPFMCENADGAWTVSGITSWGRGCAIDGRTALEIVTHKNFLRVSWCVYKCREIPGLDHRRSKRQGQANEEASSSRWCEPRRYAGRRDSYVFLFRKRLKLFRPFFLYYLISNTLFNKR